MRRRKPERGPDAPEDPKAARQAALRLLNRRDFAAAELAARLAEKGFEADAASAAVNQLVQERLVNDCRYAEHFVAYHANRGQGPVRVAHLLKQAGVAAELVEAAVDAGSAEWRRRCVTVRQKRFGGPAPAAWKERGRQSRFLTYRGFTADQVRAALGNDVDTDE